MASTGEVWRLGRRPALDGLRGIAILLVIGCHSSLPHMELAGQVGVTVFFVLSGFLITSQLLKGGRVDFRHFWLRRARRLAPALLVMMVVLFPVFIAAGWSASYYLGEAKPALLYYANYHELTHGWTLPFGHLWSLSVEEQFYLAFPLIVAALRCRPAAVLVFSTVGFAASAVARVWLSLDPSTQMRGYFGVDTNAFALLLGAGLAAAVARGWRPRNGPGLFAAGASLVGIAAAWPPVGPIFAAGVPAAVGGGLLVAAGLTPGAVSPLECRPLRYCGRVSYGWYLWQGPLLSLTWPPTQAGHEAGKLLVSLVALGVAALSWRYVEQRFNRRPQTEQLVGVEGDPVEIGPGGAAVDEDRAVSVHVD